MKKWLAVVLSAVMMMSVAACGSSEQTTPENSLYEQGLSVVSLMVEMTRSEEYVQLYTGSSEILEIVQGIGTGDYGTPKSVYALTVSNENLLEMLLGMAELNNVNLSEELKSSLESRVLGSLITRINGMSGASNLAASSVCTMGKTFVNKDVTENQIYIYTYENAKPVAVTFTMGEDGSISASGTFVLYDEFTCGSVEEIKAFFNAFKMEVTEVTSI